MPIYEYRCGKCKHEFEEIVSLSAPAPACPECGGKTEKLLSETHVGVKRTVSPKARTMDKLIREANAKDAAKAAAKSAAKSSPKKP